MSIRVMTNQPHTPMVGDPAREPWPVRASDRWLRLLLRLYPADFRDEMGEALLETYRDSCRAAVRGGGVGALAGVWLHALADSTRNGLAERVRPAVGWRRSGNWGRDTERAVRRLMRAPLFTLTMLATLTVGLGAPRGARGGRRAPALLPDHAAGAASRPGRGAAPGGAHACGHGVRAHRRDRHLSAP